MNGNHPHMNQEWRKYQNSLRKNDLSRKRYQSGLKLSIFITAFIGSVFLLRLVPFQELAKGTGSSVRSLAASAHSLMASAGALIRSCGGLVKGEGEEEKDAPPTQLSHGALQALIPPSQLNNLTARSFDVPSESGGFHITTSMDMDLQNYLLSNFDRFETIERGIPMYLAIVALTPSTGEIQAMAGFDKRKEGVNPCLDVIFPAASIFKIITASAAIEKAGLTPDTNLSFNGGKYTLYKSQLREKINKHTNRLTLRSSFAQSVNPVFGKIGKNILGKETLEQYASAFGFNSEVDFEVPVKKSRFSLSDRPYQWAEAASGFNRRTSITPLSGALIGATIVNNGRMPVPSIIEKVEDSAGKLLYAPEPRSGRTVIREGTSSALKNLMAATIKSGTAKKSFRRYKRDKVLARLNMGGKTGSIGSREHKGVRYDWFVGFAETADKEKELAISVIVAHEKYIGIRAARYARMAFTHYFQRYFSMEEKSRKVATKEKSPGESGT